MGSDKVKGIGLEPQNFSTAGRVPLTTFDHYEGNSGKHGTDMNKSCVGRGM